MYRDILNKSSSLGTVRAFLPCSCVLAVYLGFGAVFTHFWAVFKGFSAV
jgi:hypothetical protein